MTRQTLATPAAEPVAPATRRHWMVVAGAACLMVGGGFVVLSFSFLNPPMAKTLGVGVSQIMIYNSLMSVAGALSLLSFSPVAMRRLGAQRTLVIGACWQALVLLGFSYAGSLPVAYLLGFALGLTFSTTTGMMSSVLVNTWFSANRGAVLGAVMAISAVGGIALGFIMPRVVESSGWEGGFRLLAALTVVFLVVPGIFLVRSTPQDVGLRPAGERLRHTEVEETAVEVPGVPAALAFRTAQFVAVAAGAALVMAVQAAMQHMAPIYLERGVDLAAAGTLISLMSLAMVGATVVVGLVNDRRGTRTAVWVCLIAQAASMLAFVVSEGYLPLAVSTMLFAFASTFPTVVMSIVVVLVFGMKDFVGILGAVMACSMLGMGVGTPLWGVVVDATGSYRLGLIVAAGVSIVSALLMTWAIRTAPRLRQRVEHELGQGYRVGPDDAATDDRRLMDR